MVGLMDKHSFPKKTHFLYLLRVVYIVFIDA